MGKSVVPSGFTVRHYCQGIGDCHLLKFPKEDGKPYWMLIDCGVHTSISGGGQLIDEIVTSIYKETGGHLDVIVLTHEHADHISGFLASADRFADFKIGEIWMAWTESPDDSQAQELDKFKMLTLSALADASKRLNVAANAGPAIKSLRSGIDALLDFNFGAKGEKIRALRDAAVALAPDHIKYLEPDNPPISIEVLPNLRVYVLGPSRDEQWLRITDRDSEMYHLAGSDDRQIAHTLSCAFAASSTSGSLQDPTAPFDPSVGSKLDEIGDQKGMNAAIQSFAKDHYFGCATIRSPAIRSRHPNKPDDPNEIDQAWRRIDYEWLGASADLAMQLDNKTNNTSLVLAFELIDTRRVFLFAADAQVGNWLSWETTKWKLNDGDVVTGPDLLARAVYYKVGHHGSQNATLEKKGLELMTDKDLAAFIPTNKKDALNVGWGEMPFHSILTALQSSCGNRVIRADDEWLLDTMAPFKVPTGSIQGIRSGPGKSDDGNTRRRWVEIDLA